MRPAYHVPTKCLRWRHAYSRTREKPDDRRKAREKARLAAAPSVGTVVFRKDYTLISEALDAVAPAARRFTWSDSDTSADVLIATERTPGETRVTYTYRGETSTLTAPLDNDADIENAANALCFMLLSGIGRDVIASRFAHLHKIGTRLNVSEGVNGCSVIHDSYTSDFSSLRPALDFMRRRKTPRQSLTLVLSDLHHESADTDTLYRNIAALAARAGVTRLIGVGPAMSAHAAMFPMPPAWPRCPRPDATRPCSRSTSTHWSTTSTTSADTSPPEPAWSAWSRPRVTAPEATRSPRPCRTAARLTSLFANRLEPEIYSFEMLRDVIREARKNGITGYPIHIKLDTGMHRMGFIWQELPELMDILESSPEVTAKSTFSHLATSDCPDMNDYTELQLTRFAQYTDYQLARSSTPILRHVLNTAGILRYPSHHYDMARLGIGLYGANTLPPEMEKPLEVVSTLRTVIIAIRDWEAGETIGYGRRGVLGGPPGMKRHLGRGAVSVWINGHMAPTVGNICMDACMIDVTGIDCKVGDPVEIFGAHAPLQRLADALDPIPYEVLTSVSPRVKRIYYRE